MTSQEKETAIKIIATVSEIIQELGKVPSGHLYAMLMHRMSLENYNRIISILKKADLIEEENHCLIWINAKPAKVM